METDTCMLDGDWWLSPFLVLFLATLYSLLEYMYSLLRSYVLEYVERACYMYLQYLRVGTRVPVCLRRTTGSGPDLRRRHTCTTRTCM